MSHFVVWATDRAGMHAVRQGVREAHRARLRVGVPGSVKVLMGGPTTDETGAMNGSLLIVEARNIAAVHDFVVGDPYMQNGVYEAVEIRPWIWGLGRPASMEK